MGCFRRRIEIVTRDLTPASLEARCSLEDDVHHFRVRLVAENGQLTATQSEPIRTPNSLCPGAGDRLAELIAMPLSEVSAAVLVATDQHQQCTHQLDMAGLAVASLALRRGRRIYEVIVPDRIEGRSHAQLFRDGELVLEWHVSGMLIEAPASYAGRHLGAGFTRFTRDLPREEAEAALVFRRALFVSQGRGMDLENLGLRGPVGACWAWQQERMSSMLRQPQNRRDFSDRPDELGRGDQQWLSFVDFGASA